MLASTPFLLRSATMLRMLSALTVAVQHLVPGAQRPPAVTTNRVIRERGT